MLLSIPALCMADNNQQVITLKDGSQIVGQLTGISNGVYTIKAPIIGDVHASASDVVSITNSNAPNVSAPAAAAATASLTPGNVPDLDQRVAVEQKQLMSNPQCMALLTQMAQDPEIAQMLQDPSLVQAVTSHDLHAVESNPRIKDLMNNSHMQEFLKKLASCSGSPSQ